MKIDRRQFLGQVICLGATADVLAQHHSADSLPFPELKAAGSPGAMGLAHGEAFAAQIRHNVAFYLEYLSKRTGRDTKGVLSIAQTFSKVIGAHVPELLEEMTGIAKGAGCQLEEILAVNARTDLLVLGRAKTNRSDESVSATPGCTALAIEERVDGQRLLALGQNWDWNGALRKNTVILRLEPPDGPRIVTFTEAGMVGKIGFNTRRLGVCLNFLSHPLDDPEGDPGVPVHCLLRAVMGCNSLDDAVRLVSRMPRCASANFLMAQYDEQAPVALDLEWTPSAMGRLHANGGVLVHTNHFIDKALGRNVESGNSFQRCARAQRLAIDLREPTRDPAERVKQVLSRGDDDPVPLSRQLTQAGIVMDLGRNRLDVCIGPPHQGEWVCRSGV
jgi:isopenicillin-N N-acyltransferase-like protein